MSPGNFVQLVLLVLFFSLSFVLPSQAASWVTNSPMVTALQSHTATLLLNGKVLVAGGWNGSTSVSGAELFDPATGLWSATGSMTTNRYYHTATMLHNGKVLVVGGKAGGTTLSSAELYDPTTGAWTKASSLHTGRNFHTATRLPDGRVLVAGGYNGNVLASAELYDPATGTWTATDSMNSIRGNHTATLLPNGEVLVAGGWNGDINISSISSAELFDPKTGTWTTTIAMHTARVNHTATLLPGGKVLVAGGAGNSTELFDPSSGIWTLSGSMTTSRANHSASLLPNGQVLVAGGNNGNFLSSVELFSPGNGTWTTNVALKIARQSHAAVLLANGKLLVAGGAVGLHVVTNSTEIYDYAGGTWSNTGAMNAGHTAHSATLLPDGTVLVAGATGTNGEIDSVSLYNPVAGIWKSTNPMNVTRTSHTATLLPNGKVLVAGGELQTLSILSSTEEYDPVAGKWSISGSLVNPRKEHTATLLPNGKVLVAGGTGNSGYLATAELFDPTTGTWKITGPMTTNRALHTATLLSNGKVLVSGGRYGSPANYGTLASAELFDPASGTWTATGFLVSPRHEHTANLLPNGKVLVAGGEDTMGTSSGGYGRLLDSAELFDPVAGTWSNTGSLTIFRDLHTATLLPNGKVLVASGDLYDYSSELYDPAVGSWTATGTMTAARQFAAATLLPDGKVLVSGGSYPGGGYPFSSSELYDVGLAGTNSPPQQIVTITSPLALGNGLAISGMQFGGVAGSSSGNSQDSSTDYPLLQLRSLESGQTLFLSSTNWETNSFTSLPLWNFPPGYALATVFVNGIPSTGRIVNVSVPVTTVITLTGARTNNGSFQLTFTNSVGALFCVLATTNLAQPLTNWTTLGRVTEVSPTQFQFTDSQAASAARRFYRVFAP